MFFKFFNERFNYFEIHSQEIIAIYLVPIDTIRNGKMFFKSIRSYFFNVSRIKTIPIIGSCGDHDSHRNQTFCGKTNWGFVLMWRHPQKGKRLSHFCVNECRWNVILNHHEII